MDDLEEYPDWILGRVLLYGNEKQVAAARGYYGGEAIRRAIERREIDARTRDYWTLILGTT